MFVVESYIRLTSYAAVQIEFRDRFPEREPPAKRTIQKNMLQNNARNRSNIN